MKLGERCGRRNDATDPAAKEPKGLKSKMMVRLPILNLAVKWDWVKA